MIRLKGKPVFGGIARGKLLFYRRDENIVVKRQIDNTQLEMQRYEYAKTCALQELSELYSTAVNDVGKNDAGIFIIHQMIINDEDFNNHVEEHILKDRYNADYAVARTSRDYFQKIGRAHV